MHREPQEDYVFKDETYRLIGAAFEVYSDKGCGFLEPVYQECLEIEFGLQKIPFSPKPPVRLVYKGRQLEKTYQKEVSELTHAIRPQITQTRGWIRTQTVKRSQPRRHGDTEKGLKTDLFLDFF